MEPAAAAATNLFGLKDWIYLAGLALTAGTFVWKLRVDSSLARYRETVAFIEKREKDMRERWRNIQRGSLVGGELEDEIYIFMGQLELISLLLQRAVFDNELVYNYWWRYFDEPLHSAQINTWIALKREDDSSVLEHYLAQCKKWSSRLDVELGRKKQSA
jgi:hypothetical protein